MGENVKQNEQITFEAIVTIAENKAIAAAMEFNGLFEVNMENGESSFLQFFPEEKYNKQRMFAKALNYQNMVIFIPSSAEKLVIYDYVEKKIFYVDVISDVFTENPSFNKNYKFAEGIIKEDKLYLIPSTYSAIVLVELKSWKVCSVEIETSEKYLFRKGMCEVENSIYIPSTINNLVLEFDYSTLKTQIHHIGESNKGCWSICYHNGNFYLAPKAEGSILCWNKETNCVKEINGYPNGFKGNDFLFNKIYVNGDFLYLVPVYANMFLKVDVNDYTIQELNVINMGDVKSIAFLSEENGYYLLRKEKLDGLYEFFFLNTRSNEIKTIEFHMLPSGKIWKDILEKEQFLRENKKFGLVEFLEGMSQSTNKKTEEMYETKRMFGEQIAKTLLS